MTGSLHSLSRFLHSFALHHKRFKMTLTDDFTQGVLRKVRGQPDWYVLSVEGLYMAFTAAVAAYEREVRSNAVARANLEKMFPQYGSIGMQSMIVQTVPA